MPLSWSKVMPSGAWVLASTEPVSSLGMKPLGTRANSTKVSSRIDTSHHQHGAPVVHRPGETRPVGSRGLNRKPLLEGVVELAVALAVLDEAAAQHGRQSQGHETGDQDGDAHCHGELAEQATHDARP